MIRVKQNLSSNSELPSCISTIVVAMTDLAIHRMRTKISVNKMKHLISDVVKANWCLKHYHAMGNGRIGHFQTALVSSLFE